MKLYKILESGKSCHGGNLQWSLPNGKPGNWHEVVGDLNMCSNGIHLTDKPAKWFRWNCSIYEAKYEGEILWDKNESKYCARKVRLIKEVPAPDWWREVHMFVEKDIPSVQWLKPDLKPRKEWKLFKAQTWAAARDAAGDAARDAARAAAWDAALMARIKVCDGLKLDKKHIDHANARWEVWQKGYALLCDIKGLLYVYEKEDK